MATMTIDIPVAQGDGKSAAIAWLSARVSGVTEALGAQRAEVYGEVRDDGVVWLGVSRPGRFGGRGQLFHGEVVERDGGFVLTGGMRPTLDFKLRLTMLVVMAIGPAGAVMMGTARGEILLMSSFFALAALAFATLSGRNAARDAALIPELLLE